MLLKYHEWLRAFPDWRALSRAPFPNVLRAWHGLGYNRRARYLADSARIVVKRYRGRLPDSPKELEKLPGIGHYSARAIVCFAYGRCEPFVETNIRRAIIHEFFPVTKRNISDSDITKILRVIEPARRTCDWYLALMDYGAHIKGHFPNPNQRGKSYARQSRFEGSRRYVRAAIVKTLLTEKHLSERGLRDILKSNPHIAPYFKNQKWREILTRLEKDRILVYNNKQWKIAN